MKYNFFKKYDITGFIDYRLNIRYLHIRILYHNLTLHDNVNFKKFGFPILIYIIEKLF